ncbi:MAG: dihydrolipoyl dehydrogenase [Alphaproteobacteria bacterium]|nr:dihydrolipoyl dehydrogenase [Alphaproteobacteria bacterium]
MTEIFDVIVIGGGPGGYVCAIKAAQLGLKVACIEQRKTLGGTCLNVGCIPSKSLLHASKKYKEAQDHLPEWGIEAKDLKVNLKKMMERKSQVIEELTQGISFLFKKNKVHHFYGSGKIISPTKVSVVSSDTTLVLEGKNIVIATGSSNRNLPGIDIDEDRIVSSTGALSFSKAPKRLVVIGGGYIGLELGSLWQRLGSQVTVIEYAHTIVPSMDFEVGQELLKNLKKQGLEFIFGTKVLEVTKGSTRLSLGIEDVASGKKDVLSADAVLVSTGRIPNTENLGLEMVGIKTSQRGEIIVDDHFKTSLSGVYAIGDVIRGPMLAHKAEEEGVALAEILAGQKGHVNYETIPSVIYTSPEVASVGQTEEQLKEKNIPYKSGKFMFGANSRAKATGQTVGFVKVLAHKETDRILGAHIIGEDAGTLISEIVLGMEYKAASEDIARTCHPHPTTSEAIKEAALSTFSKAIHS